VIFIVAFKATVQFGGNVRHKGLAAISADLFPHLLFGVLFINHCTALITVFPLSCMTKRSKLLAAQDAFVWFFDFIHFANSESWHFAELQPRIFRIRFCIPSRHCSWGRGKDGHKQDP
jgi:hypothetical protein